jgi:hypothetical protein
VRGLDQQCQILPLPVLIPKQLALGFHKPVSTFALNFNKPLVIGQLGLRPHARRRHILAQPGWCGNVRFCRSRFPPTGFNFKATWFWGLTKPVSTFRFELLKTLRINNEPNTPYLGRVAIQ